MKKYIIEYSVVAFLILLTTTTSSVTYLFLRIGDGLMNPYFIVFITFVTAIAAFCAQNCYVRIKFSPSDIELSNLFWRHRIRLDQETTIYFKNGNADESLPFYIPENTFLKSVIGSLLSVGVSRFSMIKILVIKNETSQVKFLPFYNRKVYQHLKIELKNRKINCEIEASLQSFFAP